MKVYTFLDISRDGVYRMGCTCLIHFSFFYSRKRIEKLHFLQYMTYYEQSYHGYRIYLFSYIFDKNNLLNVMIALHCIAFKSKLIIIFYLVEGPKV